MIRQYRLKNVGEAIAIFSYLKSIGYKADQDKGDITELGKLFYNNYPYIWFDDTGILKNVSGRQRKSGYEGIGFQDIFKIEFPKNQSVKLNSEHTAVITSKEITVGCQTFPLSIIDDLVRARDKVLTN